MEMGNVAQEQLWTAVQSGASELQSLTDVLESLQLTPTARGGRPASIPLRVYVNAKPHGAFPSYAGLRYTSRPWETMMAVGDDAPEGPLVTLGEALGRILQVLPALEAASPRGAEAADDDKGDGVGGATGASLPSGCRVLVGGIAPPLETPLLWLHQHMRCLDQFLYVTLLV